MVVVDGSTETSVIALCGLQAEIIQTKKKKEKQTVCQLLQSFFILTLAPRAAQFRPNIVTSTERRRWEGVFFFFKFFIETVFTVGVEILENGEESLQMCFIMILVPRQDLEERVFYSLEKIFEFYFGGRIPFLLIREETFFKEFLIFRIFLFFITEFGCSGKLQN